MYFYFQLQFRIINRKLTEFGLRPVLGYMLAAIAFVLVSLFLFYKTAYAQYIYAVLALSFISKLSERNRNYFLKSTFKTDAYLRVRLLENLIVTAPFVVYLLFTGCFIVAGVLFLASMLLSFIRFEDRLNFTIPTPFYRYPFEFTIGFRKSVLLYALACFLAYKAIDVVNFYLGAFSVGLVFLLGVSHYIAPENEYFVWIYAANPKSFLRKKIGTALLYSSLLSIPLSIILGLYFPENLNVLIGIQGLGYLFLATTILAKYSAYPREMSVPQALVFGLCLWFPPMILVMVPLYYQQAIKRLNPYLR